MSNNQNQNTIGARERLILDFLIFLSQMNRSFRFKNRAHAGKVLSEDPNIKSLLNQNPIVLALPRGGVPIGYEYALLA